MDQSLLRRSFSTNLILTIGGAIGVALLGWLFDWFSLGAGLARLSYDLPFALRSNIATTELCLVVIDEKSARVLEQPLDRPWSRQLHADLLNALAKDGARAVLFDIIFDQAGADPASDQALADAMQASKNVFLGGALRIVPGQNLVEEQVLAPDPLFRKAAAGWGLLVFRPIDPDGEVRQIFVGTDQVPAGTWRLAHYLGASLPENPDNKIRWLNYYGPTGPAPSVSYYEVLRPREVDPRFFHNRIVIVGSRQTVGNLSDPGDRYKTPYSRWGEPFAAGADLHATILLNLLHGDWLERLSLKIEVWLIILFGLLITLLLSRTSLKGPLWSLATAAVVVLLIIATSCFVVWHYRVWLNWTVPVALQVPAALFWTVGTSYVVEAKRRAAIRRAFSLYLSPHMADQIAEESFDLKPGGKLVEATMIFTDLKGFTSLSEQIRDPLAIADVLIQYFNNTTQHVLDNNGTIIKYVGDAVFATWGAPLPDPDHAYHATLAAWGMHQFSQLNVFGHHLVTRIGINTGTVVAGNLGSDFRFDYTLLGDATNLASRLEGLNKYLNTQVLMTDNTWQRLHGRFAARPLGKFVLMGKSEPVVLYELLGPSVTNVIQAQVDSFTEGVTAFQAGDLKKAQNCMERTLTKTGGNDGPSQFYLEQIARLEASGLPSEWSGVVTLTDK